MLHREIGTSELLDSSRNSHPFSDCQEFTKDLFRLEMEALHLERLIS